MCHLLNWTRTQLSTRLRCAFRQRQPIPLNRSERHATDVPNVLADSDTVVPEVLEFVGQRREPKIESTTLCETPQLDVCEGS
jgi:hypothetical protein